MSKSNELESQLQAKLDAKLADRNVSTVDGVPVKGNTFVAVILPIIIEVLQMVMNRCNQTPVEAAAGAKAHNPWFMANLRRGIRTRRQLTPVRQESLESVVEVIDENDELTLASVVQESRDNDITWDIIGDSDG